MPDISVAASRLQSLVGSLFSAHGVDAEQAALLAKTLVGADLDGVASHGCALVPMYIDRLLAGGLAIHARPEIAEDHGGLLVVDANNSLGTTSSQFAVNAVVERAREHGIAIVSVRHAFHFGTAAYWAKSITESGMIGFAFSNTRPLMPAPGGAASVVGNNPMAIAFPSESGEPLVVDMATSATAMGRIRNAAMQGKPIPTGWATDKDGHDTTDPQEAITGMLLPAGGPKGFGIAVAIDLLCGALSSGGVGAGVKPLYGDPATPYNCAHAFIAIDANKVNNGAGIGAVVARFAQTIRDSRRAADVAEIFAPGDLERHRRLIAEGRCTVSAALAEKINALAAQAEIAERI